MQALVGFAQITVYYQQGQQPLASGTSSATSANYTGAAAYNPTVLNPPAPPNPAITTNFAIQLQNGGTPGASIPQTGSFFGFSIEMSVVNQVCETVLQVPFLNLMANLAQRVGRVTIRVGGNTQETAVLVPSTPDGKILEKDIAGASNPTQTPPLIFTPDFIYMMGNISALVNIRWHLGIPFNDTSNFRLGIAELGEAVLGDHLIGLQVGNEPDLYVAHGHRPSTYGPYDYAGEFSTLVAAVANDSNIPSKNLLIGPNIATGAWTPEMVWNTGFVDEFSTNLAFLAVEHYPTDNCYAQFGVGSPQDPQTLFPTYLNHGAGQAIVAPYLNSTAYAQTKGKQLLMFETNSASCGGFAGISDSFGAALWGLDYGMQMANSNFSGALFHVGGQSVFYNPFTPPPTNQSLFHQWTIGPIYYSALVMAEALGPTNSSQVLDLVANSNNTLTPAYAIYENGNPVKVLLFNYITDPSGANTITVNIAIGGGQTGQANATPSQVQVKYLLAPSVSTKGNFTWAGQTFGANFESDGRPQGTLDVQTVQCDQTANTCSITVPAPGVALVFLTDAALTEVTDAAPSTTFSTTFLTKTGNTLTIDPSVLATSNGYAAMDANKDNLGSTSKGSVSAAEVTGRLEGGALVLSAIVFGALMVGRGLVMW
ncbi:glycoside hydrolase family 79 protein [Laccaria bicolor S238N-H82]|uniref:Glycoside hydrolase family 79 protein n=1 Tax=Laccaria bicolor (strain S238N-H82 / ATCC MYA-4686) TaxID=486041 RepID=B0D775_LACBS|nr:glycoside hydrolase family 79 protein [Laccaria bicolor S238N-H82]EDR09602.1 glycoside hydrolase family 79 protein [Laccaria bicolor S238N-H82]|eukprot:XP_001879951.1 glycoside hydrolase family 79 protein [Laccaria bicolor S238N-H82]